MFNFLWPAEDAVASWISMSDRLKGSFRLLWPGQKSFQSSESESGSDSTRLLTCYVQGNLLYYCGNFCEENGDGGVGHKTGFPEAPPSLSFTTFA